MIATGAVTPTKWATFATSRKRHPPQVVAKMERRVSHAHAFPDRHGRASMRKSFMLRNSGQRVVQAKHEMAQEISESGKKPSMAQSLVSKLPWKMGVPMLAIGGLNIEGPASVAQAVATLATVVFVHECGHFFAARLQNIYVTKFVVGFGPKLLAYTDKDNVEYSVRAFPLGGYVAFPDDDENSDIDPEDPNLLRNRPILDRALVVSAGVIANVIFAYTVIFTQVSTIGIGEVTYLPGVVVPELLPVSAAANAGIKERDIILSIDDKKVVAGSGSVPFIVETIKDSPDKPLMFHVLRGSEELDVEVTPLKASDGAGRIGVQLAQNVSVERRTPASISEALRVTGSEFSRLSGTVLDGLVQIFFNFSQVADQVSGPVAIIAVGAEVARNDLAGLFNFSAIVSINLAVVNTLPLPALDGGYMFLLIVEGIRGKKLNQEVEQVIMSSGLLLLLSLGGYLIIRDAINLL
eukprot:CAMPEP_0114248472 /NCGR_PEP_ID=MMETSP0058-20121206/13594_1 /TAXON_ID=36894 /ORGANISM="Pyramimonas parkeae, CCMP726" /LENGTH=464 /DNA_ID=CAMNT_0001361887 /DNA_START=142 /DNA_END=1536 /DNA_ORIENTATION=-